MEQVYGKKVESYHDSTDNYIAENEVTVTITLSEYRKLVQEVATKNMISTGPTWQRTRQRASWKNLKINISRN